MCVCVGNDIFIFLFFVSSFEKRYEFCYYLFVDCFLLMSAEDEGQEVA